MEFSIGDVSKLPNPGVVIDNLNRPQGWQVIRPHVQLLRLDGRLIDGPKPELQPGEADKSSSAPTAKLEVHQDVVVRSFPSRDTDPRWTPQAMAANARDGYQHLKALGIVAAERFLIPASRTVIYYDTDGTRMITISERIPNARVLPERDVHGGPIIDALREYLAEAGDVRAHLLSELYSPDAWSLSPAYPGQPFLHHTEFRLGTTQAVRTHAGPELDLWQQSIESGAPLLAMRAVEAARTAAAAQG